MDSRTLGFKSSHISQSTWTVLKILQAKGFEAYLVGGCVRDLILGKTPKDFDVVTTATLAEIKKQFHRCIVIGRRFPICQVYMYGCKTEVSSFDTVHIDAHQRERILLEMPKECVKKDFELWKDSMRRDFTINGLFYDPFVNSIYDYVDGIRDVIASEVRTVIPAHLSFTEDCARILRGLRIVARLGLRFSRDTDIAVQDLASSILTLGKARLVMELNFMFAYGAAVPSICVLQKYKLLDRLLPIQAAYLTDQAKKQLGESSIMLMKLFSHVDELLAADHPSDCNLWLGLLAFHLALVEHPQNALVVWNFASVLYFGTWKTGVKYASESVRKHVGFAPEILELSGTKYDNLLLDETELDESLLEETSNLISLINSSLDAFINPEALEKSLAKYQIILPCSESVTGHQMIFSERAIRNVTKLFDDLGVDLRSYSRTRETSDVNYEMLKRGDADETRFVLAKIILATLKDEHACQMNEEASMWQSSYELISKPDQNVAVSGHKNMDEHVSLQNWSSIVMEKRRTTLLDGENNTVSMSKEVELNRQQHSNVAVSLVDEVISQMDQCSVRKNMNLSPPAVCDEKTEKSSKGKAIRQQNQRATAVDYEKMLKRRDANETRSMLGKTILATLNNKDASPLNKKESMRVSSDELISKHGRNAIETNESQLAVSLKTGPLSLDLSHKNMDALVSPQNRSSIAMDKTRTPLFDTSKEVKLNRQQHSDSVVAMVNEVLSEVNQDPMVRKKRKLSPPAFLNEKTVKASNGKTIRQQNQRASAVKKQPTRLDVDYETLKKGDADDAGSMLRKIILDVLDAEDGCQMNKKGTMHVSSDELIVTSRNQDELQNQGSTVMEKRTTTPLLNVDNNNNTMNTSIQVRLDHQKHQNVALDEVNCQKKQDSTIRKKTQHLPPAARNENIAKAARGKVIQPQNQSDTSAKKKITSLSSLFK